jgi:hypothetical protein
MESNLAAYKYPFHATNMISLSTSLSLFAFAFGIFRLSRCNAQPINPHYIQKHLFQNRFLWLLTLILTLFSFKDLHVRVCSVLPNVEGRRSIRSRVRCGREDGEARCPLRRRKVWCFTQYSLSLQGCDCEASNKSVYFSVFLNDISDLLLM